MQNILIHSSLGHPAGHKERETRKRGEKKIDLPSCPAKLFWRAPGYVWLEGLLKSHIEEHRARFIGRYAVHKYSFSSFTLFFLYVARLERRRNSWSWSDSHLLAGEIYVSAALLFSFPKRERTWYNLLIGLMRTLCVCVCGVLFNIRKVPLA